MPAYRFIPVLHHDPYWRTQIVMQPTHALSSYVHSWQEAEFVDVIPTTDVPIRNWVVTENRICVSYTRGVKTQVRISILTENTLARANRGGRHIG